MENRNELELLEKERNEMEDKLSELNNKIREVRLSNWKIKTGLEIGDSVSFMDGNEEKSGILESVELLSLGTYPRVQLKKKDGKLGTRVCRVWKTETLKKI